MPNIRRVLTAIAVAGSNDSSDSKQTPTQTPTEQQTPEIATPSAIAVIAVVAKL